MSKEVSERKERKAARKNRQQARERQANQRSYKHARIYREKQYYGNAIGVGIAVLLAVLMIWVATDITSGHSFDRYDNSEGVAKTFMNYIKELSKVDDLNFKEMAQTIEERIPGEESWFSNTITAISMPFYIIGKFIIMFARVVTTTFRYLF